MTEVARADRPAEKPSVVQLVRGMQGEIQKALPAHLDAERVARIALTLIGNNAALAACTPESFIGALMTASQLGLEPGPLGEAYLVPYGKQVTFIAGYRGLIKLAYQSGQLQRIAAHVVREQDEFDYELGSNPGLRHKPPKLGTPRGPAIGVYGVALLASGETPFVVLDERQVEAIRRRSRAKDNGPWQTDTDAMWRKTAIRQLARWLPMSPDLRDFGLAVAVDGSRRDVVAGREIDRVDQIPVEPEPLELEAAPAPLRAEDVRAAAAAAPRAPADEAVVAEREADWHAQGHPKTGEPRRFWDPECPVCPPDEALRTHYYGHTVDWVDGCQACQTEKAWKEQDQ